MSEEQKWAHTDKRKRRRSRVAAAYIDGYRAGQRDERESIRAAIRKRAAAK